MPIFRIDLCRSILNQTLSDYRAIGEWSFGTELPRSIHACFSDRQGSSSTRFLAPHTPSTGVK